MNLCLLKTKCFKNAFSIQLCLPDQIYFPHALFTLPFNGRKQVLNAFVHLSCQCDQFSLIKALIFLY
jgi:hypothetical protein